MPSLLWNILESLLEPVGHVLLPNTNGSNIIDPSDENKLYPALVFAISKLLLIIGLLLRGKILHFSIGFWVGLRRVADKNHLALR